MSTSWTDDCDDAEMPMSAGRALSFASCTLDAVYCIYWMPLISISRNRLATIFPPFFHLLCFPPVAFRVSSRGQQPTRIKIIFKVRTFEVGPLLVSQMQRLLVYRFRFALQMLRCRAMRDEVACNEGGGRPGLAAFWMLWVMTANNRILNPAAVGAVPSSHCGLKLMGFDDFESRVKF